MNIVIVEDERHNSKMLEELVTNFRPHWNIITILDSIKSSVKWFNSNPHPDLIFMDIQLLDGNCFSIFNQLDISSMLIFVTAYDEYAVKAFKMNSVDYLLKPVKRTELEEAIVKFESYKIEISKNDNIVDYTRILDEIQKRKIEYRKRFLIAQSDSYLKLDVSDIAYFLSENRITYAVTYKNKKLVINSTLESIEEQVDPDLFFRATRNSIINVDSVSKIENYFEGKIVVKLIAPFTESINISRLKATSFKRWIDR